VAFLTDHLLSWVTFLPLLGAILILLLARTANAARVLAMVVALADFVLSLPLFLGFDPADGGDQFVEVVP